MVLQLRYFPKLVLEEQVTNPKCLGVSLSESTRLLPSNRPERPSTLHLIWLICPSAGEVNPFRPSLNLWFQMLWVRWMLPSASAISTLYTLPPYLARHCDVRKSCACCDHPCFLAWNRNYVESCVGSRCNPSSSTCRI